MYQKEFKYCEVFQFRVTSDKMMFRWLWFLIGLALIQGLLSLSPIPVPEEEWEEFGRMMRDPSYRLPTTTRPRHYVLSLTPYLPTSSLEDAEPLDAEPLNGEPFTFDGEVQIYLSPTEANVNEIVIHCNNLTIHEVYVQYVSNNVLHTIAGPGPFECERDRMFLKIPTTEPLQLDQEYTLQSKFTGTLQTTMRGFYRSWYKDGDGTVRWMATTQFQPGHAREAFPCYDEPGFKAYFDITIQRSFGFSRSISNMPVTQTISPIPGVFADTFATTPLTSTYLLAFIVSHYDEIATGNNDDRPFSIYARSNARRTGDWSLEIGEALLTAMEEYLDYPYYTMAPGLDMKQAAIPDFSAGAMENWGLLTYREALILYDPENSNHFYRQRVANIVSHEVTHMWFGNLVTCAWWDNLWLNEGFARFYQYYLTGSVRKELGFETRFIPEQVQTALFSDSLDSAHALTDTSVNTPTAVSSHFSTITYAKGASILRMTQHLLGELTYQKALRYYIKERAFDVAEPHHLFEALDRAAAEDDALEPYERITIDQYFRTWSERAGHPLLTVIINQQTGEMIATQARWERNTGVSANPTIWQIPVTWTRGGQPDFEDLKPSVVLTGQTNVLNRGTIGNEWVIFNKQQTGFYRINYDNRNWDLITLALRGDDRSRIHELNRAQIVDDLFALARANVMTYDRAFNILSFLEFEDGYAPWISAISGFNFVIRRLAHESDSVQKLKDLIISLSSAVTDRLDFSEESGGEYMDDLLRMYVMNFLCNVGHEDCIAAGVQNFQNWRNGEFIPANMRPWVYCVGLREGDAEDFDYFWSRYLQEDLAGESIVMLEAAGCTSDQASLEKYLGAIVSGGMAGGDIVRSQDHNTALNSAVTGNEFNTQRAFTWLQNNLDQTVSTVNVATFLGYIAGRLLSTQEITEFETWLQERRGDLGEGAFTTSMNNAQAARNNLQWSANRIAELEQYFETGYVPVNIEESSEESSDTSSDENSGVVEPSDEDTSDSEEDDSANIAALSIATLVVTVAISLTA